MASVIDLAAARQFTEQLSDQLRECDNGEGTICASIDSTIDHYVSMCEELNLFVRVWARSVFTGQTEFDPETERLVKASIGQVNRRAKWVAARGRIMDEQCFVLAGLPALNSLIVDFDFLLENWVSPKRSVGPAGRVVLPEETVRRIRERVERLVAKGAGGQMRLPVS